MYYGEVNVAQEELNAFLNLAEELQVKGLTHKKSAKGIKRSKNFPHNLEPTGNIQRHSDGKRQKLTLNKDYSNGILNTDATCIKENSSSTSVLGPHNSLNQEELDLAHALVDGKYTKYREEESVKAGNTADSVEHIMSNVAVDNENQGSRLYYRLIPSIS